MIVTVIVKAVIQFEFVWGPMDVFVILDGTVIVFGAANLLVEMVVTVIMHEEVAVVMAVYVVVLVQQVD